MAVIFFYSIIVFAAILLELFFLSGFKILSVIPLALYALIAIQPSKKTLALGMAAASGIIFDFYSVYPFGFYLITFLVVLKITGWLMNNLTLREPWKITVGAVAAFVLFWFLSLSFKYILYFAGLTVFTPSFNYFLLINLIWGLAVSVFFILISCWIINFFRRKLLFRI